MTPIAGAQGVPWVWECTVSGLPTHWLSGWPKKSPNFVFTTKMVFPKSLKFMNSGSESRTPQMAFLGVR